MKRYFILAFICAFLPSGICAQKQYLTNNPILSNDETNHVNRCIDYQISFFKRAFPDKEISADSLNFTVFNNMYEYIMYRQSDSIPYESPLFNSYIHRPNEIVLYQSKYIKCNAKNWNKNWQNTISDKISQYFLSEQMNNAPIWLRRGLVGQARMLEFKPNKIDLETNNKWIHNSRKFFKSDRISLKKFLEWDTKRYYEEKETCDCFNSDCLSYAIVSLLMDADENVLFNIMRSIDSGVSSVDAIDQNYPGGFYKFEKKLRRY